MFQTPKLNELSFLVYGLGSSGLSTVNFFRRNKIKKFKVWDDKKKNLLKNFRAENLNKTLEQVDYIILAPGISLIKNKKLKRYKKKIITDIDLFFLTKNKTKSIVVTGTNGKSTTCKLLEHLLKKNKFKISLGGNIGTPILDLKNSKKNFVIIEASSFQLSHSQFIRPDFALFLNITNDHLDWHGNKINYFKSKIKIFSLQTKNQYAFLNSKLKSSLIGRKFSSKIIFPKLKEYLKIKRQINNNYLNSNINDENMSFVYSLSKIFKIKKKSFIRSMESFRGLPHRFEVFLKKKQFTFINDSKATSFISAQSALSSLNNVYWILGGIPKKGDKINLNNYKKNIIKCYLIGKNVNFFIKLIKRKLDFSITKNLRNSLLQISKDSSQHNSSKKTILLSPAAASFDQFPNFEKRGNEFKKLCKIYARKFN